MRANVNLILAVCAYLRLALLAFAACGAGLLLGGPLAWGLWQLFRQFLVDSQEMVLTFDPQCYGYALAFAAYVLGMLLLLGRRAARRTDILDIIQASHRSEPIRDVRRWYGPAGLILILVGCAAGYLAPSFFIRVCRWYPPGALTAVFYAPALVGLYLVMLHTVVNGWRRRRHYKDLISTSMMKFQGRQTVRNLLVMTLLIAGAYFASFYGPMLASGSAYSFDTRPLDYLYHWRGDQAAIPQRPQVEALAGRYGVELTAWFQEEAAVLGTDGYQSIETETPLGTTYTVEYRELLDGATFFSESAWNRLTGQAVDLAPGTCANVLDDDGGGDYVSGGDATLVTNPVSGRRLAVTPAEPLRYTMLLGCYVLDDGDYAAVTEGLPALWREGYAAFNVADVEASYPFARALFHEIVDASGPEVELPDYYDLVAAALAEGAGEPYAYDPEVAAARGLPTVDYGQRDASVFRNYWLYMPQFRILDKNDFTTTMAVFLTLFLFIALICFAAVVIIAFTRSMTIALTNARVFEDLRRLGAPNGYLFDAVRGQLRRVFQAPALVGTAAIAVFYGMILYCNDSRFTGPEYLAMGVCAAILAAGSAGLYLVYRLTRRSVCRALRIRPGRRQP